MEDERSLKIPGNNLYNSPQLRLEVREYLKQPDDDHTAWVPVCKISDDEEDPRFTVIFATNETLQRLRKSDQLHVSVSQSLIVCGVSGDIGKLSVCLLVLSSHEDCQAWTEVLSYLHSQGAHLKVVVGEGGKSLGEALQRVRSECGECRAEDGRRLTSWHHVSREHNSASGL